EVADKQLALNIVGFVQSMPPVTTRHQVELEAVRAAGRSQDQQREATRPRTNRDDQGRSR
ncbi:hypothetical protein, partial [Tepidimonas sp.]|uniref:hypothetical protein n=1 Tax=Tepidimonas sp. TaxID=2002775 RepID=UPI00391A71C5